MVIKLAVVGGSMALFLGIGALFPRVHPPIHWRVTAINLVTGALLFAFRTLLLLAAGRAATAIGGGWVDLTAQHWLIQGVACFLLLDFVRYWVHNGFVTVEKRKMSKSQGNDLRLHELLKEHAGEALRYLLLSAHYRQPLDWSDK